MATRAPDSTDRRTQIIDAAVALLRTGNAGKLTHRLVARQAGVPLGSTTYYFATLDDLATAALEQLTAEADAELEQIAARLAAGDGTPEQIAAIFTEYLADRDHVRSETALYVAGLQQPELRTLSRHWFTRTVDVLSTYTDRATATTMAVFIDGATLHAALHDEPLPASLIVDLTRLLLSAGADPAGTAENEDRR